MVFILQMKKKTKTKKPQQNHSRLREVTVCTQRQSWDVIPEPTFSITRCTRESQYWRDEGGGGGRHPRQGKVGSTHLPCSPQSPG